MSTPGPVDRDPVPFVDHQQLAIPGLGPALGGRYRHHRSEAVATVLGFRQGKQSWVTIRVSGRTTSVTLGTFERTFTPL